MMPRRQEIIRDKQLGEEAGRMMSESMILGNSARGGSSVEPDDEICFGHV